MGRAAPGADARCYQPRDAAGGQASRGGGGAAQASHVLPVSELSVPCWWWWCRASDFPARHAARLPLAGTHSLRACPPHPAHSRPDQAEGSTFLKLRLHPGGSVKRASAALAKAIAAGWLQELELAWLDTSLYEAEVAPLQRFLVDLPVSGGAWLYVEPPLAMVPLGSGGRGLQAPVSPGPAPMPRTPRGGPGSPASPPTSRPPTRAPGSAQERLSSCDLEVVAPWRSIHCLTPDATQLADPSYSPLAGIQASPVPPQVAATAESAVHGELAPLRVLVLDVLCGTADGMDRVAVATQDPVVAIACTVYTLQQHQDQQQQQQQHGEGDRAATALSGAAGPSVDDDGGGLDGAEEEEDEGPVVVASAAAVAGGPTSARAAEVAQAAALGPQRRTVLFLVAKAGASPHQQRQADVGRVLCDRSGAGPSASVLVFEQEAELLLTWLAFFRAADPDVRRGQQPPCRLRCWACRQAAWEAGWLARFISLTVLLPAGDRSFPGESPTAAALSSVRLPALPAGAARGASS